MTNKREFLSYLRKYGGDISFIVNVDWAKQYDAYTYELLYDYMQCWTNMENSEIDENDVKEFEAGNYFAKYLFQIVGKNRIRMVITADKIHDCVWTHPYYVAMYFNLKELSQLPLDNYIEVLRVKAIPIQQSCEIQIYRINDRDKLIGCFGYEIENYFDYFDARKKLKILIEIQEEPWKFGHYISTVYLREDDKIHIYSAWDKSPKEVYNELTELNSIDKAIEFIKNEYNFEYTHVKKINANK